MVASWLEFKIWAALIDARSATSGHREEQPERIAPFNELRVYCVLAARCAQIRLEASWTRQASAQSSIWARLASEAPQKGRINDDCCACKW